MLRKLVLVFVSGLLFVMAGLSLAAEERKVLVETRVVPPMVMKGPSGELTGFSIELWSAIARELQWQTTFQEATTLPAMLRAVKDRQTDLAISAISITAEREKEFEYSQPILDAGLQILVKAGHDDQPVFSTLWQIISSPAMRDLFLIFLILVLVPTPIIWLVDRFHPASFARAEKVRHGLGRTVWWSSSALVGQATEMPSTFIGRFLAILVMFTGVVFVSYFTASVTASLTVKKLDAAISKLSDLPGKRVGSVGGSSAEIFLGARKIKVVPYANVVQAVEAVVDGKLDAVVYDAPPLSYIATHDMQGKVQVVGEILKPESYGILFPEGSPLRKQVNEALLHLKENGEHDALRRKYFAAPTDK